MKRRISRLAVLALTMVMLAGFAAPSLTFAAQTPPSAASAASKAPAGGLLDINTASLSQLKALPGIGDVYAQKIVDGRPYARKDQLLQKHILPQATYNKIAGMIIARQPK